MNEEESKRLAVALAQPLLRLAEGGLAEYLRETYSVDGTCGLSTDTVDAVEVEDADFATGSMLSSGVWCWRVTREACQPLSIIDARPLNAASDAGKLWPHPIISYFARLPTVLYRETIGWRPPTPSSRGGQTLAYYRLFTVRATATSFEIDSQEKAWLFGS
jgi:hypothetical protein